MITLPEYLEQPFKRLAEQKHQSADKLLAQLIEEYLEDYHDIQLAEQAIAEINSGKAKVLSLADARKLYDELVN
jgi:predicted DNA-binding protein